MKQLVGYAPSQLTSWLAGDDAADDSMRTAKMATGGYGGIGFGFGSPITTAVGRTAPEVCVVPPETRSPAFAARGGSRGSGPGGEPERRRKAQDATCPAAGLGLGRSVSRSEAVEDYEGSSHI